MPEVAGGAALLAHPDDLDGLREQLGRVLTDDDWRVDAVVRGLDRARLMTWGRCVAKTVDVYKAVS
jgi:alpha-1,3-rhamnosyl/mannosyltransferase